MINYQNDGPFFQTSAFLFGGHERFKEDRTFNEVIFGDKDKICSTRNRFVLKWSSPKIQWGIISIISQSKWQVLCGNAQIEQAYDLICLSIINLKSVVLYLRMVKHHEKIPTQIFKRPFRNEVRLHSMVSSAWGLHVLLKKSGHQTYYWWLPSGELT